MKIHLNSSKLSVAIILQVFMKCVFLFLFYFSFFFYFCETNNNVFITSFFPEEFPSTALGSTQYLTKNFHFFASILCINIFRNIFFIQKWKRKKQQKIKDFILFLFGESLVFVILFFVDYCVKFKQQGPNNQPYHTSFLFFHFCLVFHFKNGKV